MGGNNINSNEHSRTNFGSTNDDTTDRTACRKGNGSDLAGRIPDELPLANGRRRATCETH